MYVWMEGMNVRDGVYVCEVLGMMLVKDKGQFILTAKNTHTVGSIMMFL